MQATLGGWLYDHEVSRGARKNFLSEPNPLKIELPRKATLTIPEPNPQKIELPRKATRSQIHKRLSCLERLPVT